MKDSIATTHRRGVIVEFDYTALPGHNLLFKVCRERMAREKIDLDEIMMSRIMNGKSLSHAFSLLTKQFGVKLNTADTALECYAKFEELLNDEAPTTPPSFLKFVETLTDRGVKVVLVTRIANDKLDPVFTSIASDDLVVTRETASGFGFYGWDVLRRVADNNHLPQRLCLVATGSGYTVKAALFNGMAALAKPNKLTDYQDFSGANGFFNEFSVAVAEEALHILKA